MLAEIKQIADRLKDLREIYGFSVETLANELNIITTEYLKYESLGFNFADKKAEPFLVTVNPEIDNSELIFSSHPGQEFNYVIEGSLQLFIDSYDLILQEGDSAYFNSSYNHTFKALNNNIARLLL